MYLKKLFKIEIDSIFWKMSEVSDISLIKVQMTGNVSQGQNLDRIWNHCTDTITETQKHIARNCILAKQNETTFYLIKMAGKLFNLN